MQSKPRPKGRRPDELRKIEFIPSPQKAPDGSVLIKWGDTHVLCSVSIEDKVPNWMGSKPTGWITAEYGMLPGSSDKRIHRDKIRSTGRTHEIQRLIGRSLRACIDMKELGLRTITLDCDVVQADGGTRVAAITGSYVALRMALAKLREKGTFKHIPKTTMVSAVSLGRHHGGLILDLEYVEDVEAELDSNVVMNEHGEFIEIQGTAEKGTFKRAEWDELLSLAEKGCRDLFEIQRRTIQEWGL